MSKYVAVDRYGQTLFLKEHPRAELVAYHGTQHAEKMYCDRGDVAYHIGYIVADHWYTVLGLEGVTFATEAGMNTSTAADDMALEEAAK